MPIPFNSTQKASDCAKMSLAYVTELCGVGVMYTVDEAGQHILLSDTKFQSV